MKMIKLLTAIVLMVAASTAIAVTAMPYVGADINWRQNSGVDFGGTPAHGAFYVGLNFDDIALEVGHYNYIYKSCLKEHKAMGKHFSVIKRFDAFVDQRVALLLGVGLTFSKKTDTMRFKDSTSAIKDVHQQAVPRLMGALEFAFNDNVSLRMGVTLEQSGAYRKHTARMEKETPRNNETLLKNDISATLGLKYTF